MQGERRQAIGAPEKTGIVKPWAAVGRTAAHGVCLGCCPRLHPEHRIDPPVTSLRSRLLPRLSLALLISCAATGSEAARPSFDCANPKLSSVEKVICGDDQLAALDARMALTYAEAAAQSVRWKLPLPDGEQQAWLRQRAACAGKEARACLAALYPRRIAELQASYALVRGRVPVELTCGGEPVTLFFFDTDPGVAVVHRAGVASTLFREKTASGIRYASGERSYTEHQGNIRLKPGSGAPLACKVKR